MIFWWAISDLTKGDTLLGVFFSLKKEFVQDVKDDITFG